ncbi:glyoxalase [Burkholderia pseudomallei]|nr:glyoxalase [Burkholderia pseudomallei]AYX07701.1 glyoxalase [Burkholderia pseudomallei]AYX34129.1 glyoxalase [Burkholderia pseudomallei]PNX10344.1 glyoxalase [Burkholderia pseudomallei]PNX44735.1 glyoxalase [Burkholderia pseudomallei]
MRHARQKKKTAAPDMERGGSSARRDGRASHAARGGLAKTLTA